MIRWIGRWRNRRVVHRSAGFSAITRPAYDFTVSTGHSAPQITWYAFA
jgi:hypothetical protein